MHSGTKYLGGHSDLCCGALLGPETLIERIRGHALMYGGSLNAQDCYLLERSLKTLDLRVRKQSANALELAGFLSGHRAVRQVYYPGLEQHPGHAIARRQMAAFGGMLSFELAADADPVAFLRALDWVRTAVSLGGVETIASQPVATSHERMPAAERERLGIRPGLIRISAGIEDAADLLDVFGEALNSVR